MRYQQLNSGDSYPYPSHDIDPARKNAEWCMQYAKAAYYDWSIVYPKGMFANNGGNYDKYRMYALGKQPIGQYKKLLGVDSVTDQTWMSIDWSVRSVVSGYRDKAISRLLKDERKIIATPVDSQSKTELDEYYSSLKSKLIVRELMMQQNPELAKHPLLSIQSGEPMDIEELEMRVMNGEQFNRSMDAELAIELGFYENDYETFRRQLYEDLFDFGVAGKKEWLGDDSKAKFRRINPDCIVTNYCKDPTFKDLIHAGEVIDVPLVELATLVNTDGTPLFTEDELTEFAGSLSGKFGNPTTIGNRTTGRLRPYDKFKCKVLDIEFFTYNDNVYRTAPDSNGNNDFRKADYGRGKKSDKYTRKRIQYVYKCKWIVGSDKCYDWGMCYDQKRSVDVKDKAKTKLSYTFCAYNFYEMNAQGIMERLIPYIDDYQLTMLKIQNFKNRAVPSGWWINLDALENVALTKGGATMQPKELLKMFFETGVLVGRSLDAAGQPMFQNTQPVIPIDNTAASELQMFYQDLLNTVMAIEKMTGYNDITSGNPNPKTLVPGYELAQQATSDALYPLAWAEKYISVRLAEDVFCRMQQGIRKGKVSGYAPYKGALGNNTIRFIELDGGISLREHGIELQEATTEKEKEWIFMQIQADIQNGFLDVSDAIMVINTQNAKQAMSILAYRVKKAKDTANKQKMAEIQAQNEGTQQAAMIAQQGAMQVLQLELQAKVQINRDTIDGELEKERIRVESAERIATQSNQTKLAVGQDAGDAKMLTQHIANQKETSAA
jgi:hypothetical protein